MIRKNLGIMGLFKKHLKSEFRLRRPNIAVGYVLLVGNISPSVACLTLGGVRLSHEPQPHGHIRVRQLYQNCRSYYESPIIKFPHILVGEYENAKMAHVS
jgi:hypothetical protein